MKKNGFTLIEILLVVGIVGLMVVLATGAIDPGALINKGNDATRKKDLNRIKVAMEDYYTDKGCYPLEAMVDNLNDSANCGSDIFDPWLASWPCDPQSGPYYLVVEENSCPSWFKLITQLRNKKDRDILSWWYDFDPGTYLVADGRYSNADVNWGVSSTNVLWYERNYPQHCFNTGQCQTSPSGQDCQASVPNYYCSGSNCFLDGDCSPECQVSCCRDGQPCE